MDRPLLQRVTQQAGCKYFVGRDGRGRENPYASLYGRSVAVLKALALLGLSRHQIGVTHGGYHNFELRDVHNRLVGSALTKTGEDGSADVDRDFLHTLAN